MALKKGDLILFQGDSVTDCERDRTNVADLGNGYAKMVAKALAERYPGLELRFQNRGISGDRTYRLLNRWETECIELRPALLSILIGINDIWHRDKGTGSTDEEIEKNCTKLLTRTRQALGDIPLLLLEPYLTPDHTTVITREEIDSVRLIMRRLATEFNAVFVPLDEPLARNSENLPPHTLTREGVHPTEQGHAIIAKQWMDAALPLL